MRCELIHILGTSVLMVERKAHFFAMSTGLIEQSVKRYGYPFIKVTGRGYAVFSFGHHVSTPKNGGNWESVYKQVLEDELGQDFGRIPDNYVFFQMTSVHNFKSGIGYWNTHKSKYVGVETKMEANCSMYGGSIQENLAKYYGLAGNT